MLLNIEKTVLVHKPFEREVVMGYRKSVFDTKPVRFGQPCKGVQLLLIFVILILIAGAFYVNATHFGNGGWSVVSFGGTTHDTVDPVVKDSIVNKSN